MNKSTLLILTALIISSPLKTFAQNHQTETSKQPVQEENQQTAKVNLDELSPEQKLEYLHQLNKSNIQSWQNTAELAEQIAGYERTGYDYNYGY